GEGSGVSASGSGSSGCGSGSGSSGVDSGVTASGSGAGSVSSSVPQAATSTAAAASGAIRVLRRRIIRSLHDLDGRVVARPARRTVRSPLVRAFLAVIFTVLLLSVPVVAANADPVAEGLRDRKSVG